MENLVQLYDEHLRSMNRKSILCNLQGLASLAVSAGFAKGGLNNESTIIGTGLLSASILFAIDGVGDLITSRHHYGIRKMFEYAEKITNCMGLAR